MSSPRTGERCRLQSSACRAGGAEAGGADQGGEHHFTLDDARARLGDIVFCYIPEIGVNVKARVIGMTETSQDNVTTREAAIGTPVVVRRY